MPSRVVKPVAIVTVHPSPTGATRNEVSLPSSGYRLDQVAPRLGLGDLGVVMFGSSGDAQVEVEDRAGAYFPFLDDEVAERIGKDTRMVLLVVRDDTVDDRRGCADAAGGHHTMTRHACPRDETLCRFRPAMNLTDVRRAGVDFREPARGVSRGLAQQRLTLGNWFLVDGGQAAAARPQELVDQRTFETCLGILQCCFGPLTHKHLRATAQGRSPMIHHGKQERRRPRGRRPPVTDGYTNAGGVTGSPAARR